MTKKQIAFWALLFKLVWVITLTQAGPRPIISTLVVWSYAIVCGLQQSRQVWRLVAIGIGCSVIGDGLLGWSGVLANPDGSAFYWSPLWLIGLWAAFATLLPICFTWLYEKLWLAAVLGMASGTLSYISGGKMGALLVSSDWGERMWIAGLWGMALPLLVWMARK